MSGMAIASTVKFFTHVDCIKCWLLDDKPSLKEKWSR